jgi:8-oxo-dGTP pyrophosphatase MutT (NUDIX family)
VAHVVVKNRRLAAENSKWQVYFDHVTDGHGNEVSDYLVLQARDHGHDLITGVAVLPLIHGQFVLVRSYRHALGAELWEAPRGFIDAGEIPAAAGLRELTEETGLTCAPEHLISLGSYAPEASTIAARCALFVATRCEGVPRARRDELGLNAWRLIEPLAMAALVAGGAIEDPSTLIAYYRFCALPHTLP